MYLKVFIETCNEKVRVLIAIMLDRQVKWTEMNTANQIGSTEPQNCSPKAREGESWPLAFARNVILNIFLLEIVLI